jgi:very-short-patch-repair endonuclease
LAGRQHGVVARRQLLAMGLGSDAIGRRVRGGRLWPIHRGVYAVGHSALTRRSHWMAAVLASGPDAVLSHAAAAALWGIWKPGSGRIDVTVPRSSPSTKTIRKHCIRLAADELATVGGIPVTSAARAVLDLAAEKGETTAEAALREMEYLRIYGPVSLPVLLDRYPRHRGTAIVQVCLERLRDDPGGRVRSPLEELFLPFLDAHRIPRPRLNAWLTVEEQRYQVDCLWAEARLVGELDGFKSHGTKRAFRKDRKRDRRLGVAGYGVVRITEDQLLDEPSELAADLTSLLNHSVSAPVTVTPREDRDRGRLPWPIPAPIPTTYNRP